MLLLPLAGNPSVDKSGTISLIQIKLRENRLLYKTKCKVPDFTANTKPNGASPVMKQIKEDFSSDDEVDCNVERSPVEAKCSPITTSQAAVLVHATAVPLEMNISPRGCVNAVSVDTPMYIQQNVSCVVTYCVLALM